MAPPAAAAGPASNHEARQLSASAPGEVDAGTGHACVQQLLQHVHRLALQGSEGGGRREAGR